MTIATKTIKLSIIKRVLAENNLYGQIRLGPYPGISLGIDFDDGQGDAQVFLVMLCIELSRIYDRRAVVTLAEDVLLQIFDSSSSLYAHDWKILED